MEAKMGTPLNFQPSSYPATRTTQQSQLPNSTSAVSINIINPQAYSGMPAPQEAPQMAQPYCCPAPMYNYAPAPFYEVPQVPIYGQQPSGYFPTSYATAPIQQNVVAPQISLPAQPTAIAPAAQPAQDTPVPPPPSLIDQQPVPVAVETQKAVQEVPASVATETKAPVETPQPAVEQVDVAAITKALASTNLEEQQKGIEKIAEIGQLNNQQSAALINEEVFKGLSGIASKDTSKLPGKTQQQLELSKKKQSGKALNEQEEVMLNTPSQKELAEQNKIISMWTMAVLQKNLRDAINSGLAPNDPPVPLHELPGVKEIENNIKHDSNPLVRSAGIQAFRYVAQPTDYPMLSTILNTVIKVDKDPAVKADAQSTLAAIPNPKANAAPESPKASA
jgi:hypothetical protein